MMVVSYSICLSLPTAVIHARRHFAQACGVDRVRVVHSSLYFVFAEALFCLKSLCRVSCFFFSKFLFKVTPRITICPLSFGFPTVWLITIASGGKRVCLVEVVSPSYDLVRIFFAALLPIQHEDKRAPTGSLFPPALCFSRSTPSTPCTRLQENIAPNMGRPVMVVANGAGAGAPIPVAMVMSVGTTTAKVRRIVILATLGISTPLRIAEG